MKYHCIECDSPHPKGWGKCNDCGTFGNGIPDECGPPFGGAGIANVIPDSFTPHMDWSLGMMVSSRSQRRRLYAENDMHMKSVKESFKDKDTPNVNGHVVSYAGQKFHKSSAERGGVRTKTGQLVI